MSEEPNVVAVEIAFEGESDGFKRYCTKRDCGRESDRRSGTFGQSAFRRHQRLCRSRSRGDSQGPCNGLRHRRRGALWPISFRVLGNDLQEVYRQAEAQTQIVKEFLKSGGIKPDEITDASPKVDDAQANMYGENKRAYRYILTPSVTVSTKNVDAVLALQRSMSELIAKGVTPTEDYSFRTIFNYTKLNSIKPAMIEAATVNAREAAEKFAKDSGSTLGKIRRASQGQFQIFDRDANTRWIKNVRVVTTVEYYLKD